jgi:hypothetical protein
MATRDFGKYPLRADETVEVLKTQAAKALVGPAGQVRLAALTPRVLDTAATFIEAHAEIFEQWVAAGSSLRDAAVEDWALYCRRFGHDPESLRGMRYPGHERHPMDDDMIRDVASRLSESYDAAMLREHGAPPY